MATCGEVLVELLGLYGIDTVFGIPGVHTVELYRGLPNSKLRHITPRHEQGAGFMADGYARASGRPAACFIITGPGLTNIATALGQAYADFVPILILSSVNNTRDLALGEGRLHELPSQRGLMEGLTAFSHTLLWPDELPHVLARAFAVFDSGRPRPVHIELPLDVITADADHVRRTVLPGSSRPAPDPQPRSSRRRGCCARRRRPLVGVRWRRPACGGVGARCRREARRAGRHHHQRQGHPAAGPSAVARQHAAAAAGAGRADPCRRRARHRHGAGRDRYPAVRQPADAWAAK